MFPGRFVAVLASAVLVIGSALQAAEPANRNWTHWRGPTGQGYSDDTRVPLTWSDTENLLWKTVTLPGQGNSSPIVWGDRIFLTSASKSGDERFVFCISTTGGKVLWQQRASQGGDAGKTHEWNGYASASCTTDGTHVYAFFGTPGLFCYNMEGKLIWKHDFGVFTADTGWGTGASPFLFEDLVIQNCDNDGPRGLKNGANPAKTAPMALVALDKKTGQVRWQTERNQGKGWSTPVLVPMPNGRIDLVLNGPFGVWGYDPRTGKELWHCERHRGEDSALFGEPLPAFKGDMLYASSGRPGPFQAIRLGGSGDLTASSIVWDKKRPNESRDVASPILWGDYLYLADRRPNLTCYERTTGNIVFKKDRIGAQPVCASPVAVRGKLLFLVEDGDMLVLEPGAEYKVVRHNKLTDDTPFRASPAIVDGRMYLRSQSHLYCIGEKK
jgi:outer membrane protein assembly factor BamB